MFRNPLLDPQLDICMNKTRAEIFACGLWVAATALMAFGSFDSQRAGHTSPLLAWGLFAAVAACVPSLWCIVTRACAKSDEASVDHIIEVVDALHRGRREMSHVGHR